MANKIIKGYWDCPQCGTKGIDGLLDACPNCGSGKDKNVRYYMKDTNAVSEEELNAAGLSKEDADGSHKEWICAYCGSLNNYRDTVCARCGADREEKAQDYGGDTSEVAYEKDKSGQLNKKRQDEEIKKTTYTTKEEVAERARQEEAAHKSKRGLLILIAAIVVVLAIVLWPHTKSEAITGFAWDRTVTVEELQTFSESGWSLPEGARQTDAKRELYGYDQVLDHYETVNETRTRQVIDHYDTSYTYKDNGNGTFTEQEVKTPVYKTETYTEPVKKPVYVSVPRYQTKYYYDIDRWVKVDDYKTSGEDHDPYWSDEYTLAENQRDTERTENYYTIYSEKDRKRVPYEKWSTQEIGDGIYVTKNTVGMEYSRKERK